MGPVRPKRDKSADLSLAGRAYNLAYWYSCREGAGPPMADKRVERTKGYLREALEELLREKPLERITVTEVLARAEVSKNAFYTHYGSLTALVEDCYLHRLVYFCGTNKRRGDYATREEAITETMEQRARLLYDFKRNPNLARAVLTNAGTSPYFASCEAAEEELNVDHLVTEYGTGERVADYLDDEDCAHFIASGCFAMERRWVRGGMVDDIEHLVKAGALLSLSCTAAMVGHRIEPEYKAAIEAWHFDPEAGESPAAF